MLSQPKYATRCTIHHSKQGNSSCAMSMAVLFSEVYYWNRLLTTYNKASQCHQWWPMFLESCKYSGSTTGRLNAHLKKHFYIVEAVCIVCRTKPSFKRRFDLKNHLDNFHRQEFIRSTKIVHKGFEVYVAVAVSNSLPVIQSNGTSRFLELILNWVNCIIK